MEFQMKELAKKHAQKIKFGIVGAANTGLDFVILFVLTNLGLHPIISNYISTGVAFLFSFTLNRSFTFKAKSGNVKKQLGLFIAVTALGLWVLQPIIIAFISWALSGTGWSENIILFIAKLLATVATLIWNYLFYSRIVFKEKK